jgi:hypothetical protein
MHACDTINSKFIVHLYRKLFDLLTRLRQQVIDLIADAGTLACHECLEFCVFFDDSQQMPFVEVNF